MLRRLLKMAGLLLPRFDHKERGVALAIFLVCQALLPSYAVALSAHSGQDALVLCTSHGLIEVNREGVPRAPAEIGDRLCVLAQMAGFAFAEMPSAPVLQFAFHQSQNLKNHYPQSQLGRFDYFEPQAQRAPPVMI